MNDYIMIDSDVLFNTDISIGALKLYLILIAITPADKRVVEKRGRDLSEYMGYSERQVWRYVEELKDAELLHVVSGQATGSPNQFKVLHKGQNHAVAS